MNAIYTLSIKTKGDSVFTATVKFNPAHPLFSGHFPGLPVVPGVLLMEIAASATRQFTGKELIIKEASVIKFIRIIDPRKDNEVMLDVALTEEEGKYKLDLNFYHGETVFVKVKGMRLYPRL
jgi:3-hydroxyacyl-[acyl-carrier-protein] dehydratase